MESVLDDLAMKQSVFDEIERVVASDAVIASNTSAIPISVLQQTRRIPQRFVGMHWAEPAHATRFLELIRGEATSDETVSPHRGPGTPLGQGPDGLPPGHPGIHREPDRLRDVPRSLAPRGTGRRGLSRRLIAACATHWGCGPHPVVRFAGST